MSDNEQLDNRRIAERLGWTDVSADKARVAFVDSVVLTGIPPLPNGDIQVPDYTGSTDAALTLCINSGMAIQLNYRPDEQRYWAKEAYHADSEPVFADTPAAAVCAAWWAWMDEREAE